MADVFSKEKRSEIMSKIRSKNTKAEMDVFSALRKEGVYFQKHYKKALGCLDIALPRKKIAIFIDGDFWHGRHFESWVDRMPNKYWKEKIANNIKRDRKNSFLLKKDGWRVKRIWETQVEKDLGGVIKKIVIFIKSNY
ncbi:MAG: very short patch repair endonuclease [Candidatus Moranbacteria bacterium]|nr:very short patch repair endonuclease [Candidatus Moranbacteria bacterium]